MLVTSGCSFSSLEDLEDPADPVDPVDLEGLVRPERLVDQEFPAVLVVQVVLEYPEILLILEHPVDLVSLQFRL